MLKCAFILLIEYFLNSQKHGIYIEWKSVEPITSEPTASTARAGTSPYSDAKSWAFVDKSSKVGFKVGSEADEGKWVVAIFDLCFDKMILIDIT